MCLIEDFCKTEFFITNLFISLESVLKKVIIIEEIFTTFDCTTKTTQFSEVYLSKEIFFASRAMRNDSLSFPKKNLSEKLS